jgi:hypothetical protein
MQLMKPSCAAEKSRNDLKQASDDSSITVKKQIII